MALEALARVDEHAVVVAAPPDAVWDASLATLRQMVSAPRARLFARLLGCDPATSSGWDGPVAGATVPGFRVVEAARPTLLVLAGRHRFSRYGIVLRIDPVDDGARCRVESRADFPGPHGALYRFAVIRTRFHVGAVRQMLRRIKRTAEQGVPPAR